MLERAQSIRFSGSDLTVVEHATNFGTASDSPFTAAQVLEMKGDGKQVVAYMSIASVDNHRAAYTGGTPGFDGYAAAGVTNVPLLQITEQFVDYWTTGSDGHPKVLVPLKQWLKANFDAGYDGVFLDVVEAHWYTQVRNALAGSDQSLAIARSTTAAMDIIVELDKYAQTLAQQAGRTEFKIFLGHSPDLIDLHRDTTASTGETTRLDLIQEIQSRVDGVLVESRNNTPDSGAVDFLNMNGPAQRVVRNLVTTDKAENGYGSATVFAAIYGPETGQNFIDGSANSFAAMESMINAAKNGFIPYATPFHDTRFNLKPHLLFNESTNAADAFLLSAAFANASGGGGSDLIVGHSGVNTIDAGDGNDIVRAEGGGDTVNGDAGDDTIEGGSGNDTLNGGTGNDVVTGGTGNDIADGGAGSDEFIADGPSAAFQIVDEGGGVFRLERIGSSEVDRLAGFESVRFNDTTVALSSPVIFPGTPGPDVKDGSAYNDVLSGAAGNDTLKGLGGDDQLNGDAGNDTLNGGEGNDTVDGGAGNDQMTGGGGNDSFFVDSTADKVYEDLNGGFDTIFSNVSNNNAIAANVERLELLGSIQTGRGNSANNQIAGNSAVNYLYGGDGNDAISGGLGNDRLYGEAGDDTLDGGGGNDIMQGGAGNDVYIVNSQTDTLTEVSSAGIDHVFSTAGRILGSYFENLTLTGTASVFATGNTLANVIVGNSGSNLIYGAGGNDTLTGGAGPDRFDFRGYTASFGVDTITDYTPGVDALYIARAGFNSVLYVGDEVYVRTGAAPSPEGTGPQFLYNTANGDLSFDRDGTGAAAAVKFAVIAGAPALTGSDFVVY
jgi:Ca2+-binding RTX toxin-like protein